MVEPVGQRWIAGLFARAGAWIATRHGADARLLRPSGRLIA